MRAGWRGVCRRLAHGCERAAFGVPGGRGSDGADTSGETFLRGTQVTDGDGAGGV